MARQGSYTAALERNDQRHPSPQGPWRAVTQVHIVRTSGRPHRPTRLTLECGHQIMVYGEKAYDARYSKRKRCHACLEPVEK